MTLYTKTRHQFTDPELVDVLELLRASFAYMDQRVDPPSSLHLLTLDDVRSHCERGEVWSLFSADARPVACVFLSVEGEALYMGRLAVAESYRGHGLCRQLLAIADERATFYGKDFIELKSRVELTEVHAVFDRLGFNKSGEGRHDGYPRPTYYIMKKAAVVQSSP